MTDSAAFVAHVARESDRFLQAISTSRSDAPVPSCPSWTADDLLWHLAEVQFFWAVIVRERLDDPSRAQQSKPPRPADRAGLSAFYRQASDALRETLAETDPTTPVWTWSTDRTVRFVKRRQAHEALIHRIDAELTAGARSPIDPTLASDGVDEALRVMYGGAPQWGRVDDQGGATIRLRAIDANCSWLVTIGRFTGTDPDSRTVYDEPGLVIADSDMGGQVMVEIAARAADLDCWLWSRPTEGSVHHEGDPEVFARFEQLVATGIQ